MVGDIVQKEAGDLSTIYKSKPFDLPSQRKRKSQINDESAQN